MLIIGQVPRCERGGNVQISFSWARAKVEESEKRVVFLRVGAGLPPHVFPRGGGVRLDMDLMMSTKAWGGGGRGEKVRVSEDEEEEEEEEWTRQDVEEVEPHQDVGFDEMTAAGR